MTEKEEEEDPEEAALDWLKRSRLRPPPRDRSDERGGRGVVGVDELLRIYPSLAASSMLTPNDDGYPATRNEGAGGGAGRRRRSLCLERQNRPLATTTTTSTSDEADEDDYDDDEEEEEICVDLIRDSMPRGVGVAFLDALFASSSRSASAVGAKRDRRRSWPVVEIGAPPCAGKTSTLLTLAAKYAAGTGVGFLLGVDDDDKDEQDGDCDDGDREEEADDGDDVQISTEPQRRRRKRRSTFDVDAAGAAVPPPNVVVMDSECGTTPCRVASIVRSAALRRWDETEPVRAALSSLRRRRRRKNKRRRHRRSDDDDDDENDDGSDETGPTEECRRLLAVEDAVASTLGRIHVVRPGDYGHAGFVPALESLRASLDDAVRRRSRDLDDGDGSGFREEPLSPPTMVLIDSLSAFEGADSMSDGLGGGGGTTGLSGKNEFVRQLRRLRDRHPLVVVATKATTSSTPFPVGGGKPFHEGWNRMVTRRCSLTRAKAGTEEERSGYDFVALVNRGGGGRGGEGTGAAEGVGGGGNVDIVPYSISSSGIRC